MKSYKLIKTLQLLPSSYRHVRWVTKQLEHNSYEKVLTVDYNSSKKDAAIIDIVKSYFWASRLIARDHCLPRSIALYQNLLKRGLEVEHKFGVNKTHNQFMAHAWVEYQGKPLNEHPNLHQRFKVLETQK